MDFSLIHILNILAGSLLCISLIEAAPKWLGKSLASFVKCLGGLQTVIGVILFLYIIFLGLWTTIYGIIAVFGALILMAGILPFIPLVGSQLKKLAVWLGTFQGIIGIVLILSAIWGILAI